MRTTIPFLLAASFACSKPEVIDSGDSAVATPACEALGLPARSWHEGPYEAVLRGVAGDFTVPTTAGDWSFSQNFSGCETYLFVPSVPRSAADWSVAIWEQDIKELFDKLPRNAHLFFVSSSADKKGRDADLALIEKKVQNRLTKLPDEEAEWRRARVHYVTKSVDKLDGWVGDYLRNPGHGFGIDRFQRIRDIGSLADGERYDQAMGWFAPNLAHVAHEAILYDFEATRQQRLDADGADVVRVWTQRPIADPHWAGVKELVEVELPPKADLARYDTLELDMTQTCEGAGEVGYCPAWDRLTHLYVCDVPAPLPSPDPHADQACEAGDTVPCDCENPDGTADVGARACNDEGTGFGECSCDCDAEIGRWVTTYHREGRWLSDASFALPWLAQGGTVRLGYHSIDPWEVTLDLRFSTQDRPRPVATRFLFGGGAFGPAYNDKYAPIEIEIPASAKKVELAYIITGHGMEMPENCAEFCDTNHRFGVNGEEHLVHFPEIGDQEHCQNDVVNGTIPNQYGTWFYGRSNWCPGKQVDPVYIDITDQVELGAVNTFTYSGDYDGAPYHSNGASIALSSWLVIRE